jgi:hypothetical protein
MENSNSSRDEIIKIILDISDIDLQDKEIFDVLKSNQISKNINSSHRNSLTKGDIMSDRLAAFAGSLSLCLLQL